MRHLKRMAGCWLACVLGLALVPSAGADEADFYKGKTVTVIVATKPGGGYDVYGRMLAKVLPKYLPGSTVVVKNVPGAGHIIGCNEIYRAKPDGLTFGLFNKGLISSQLLGLEGIRFDLRKMSWLGSPATEPRLFVVSTKSPFKKAEDLTRGNPQVILSSAGIGSASHTDAVMVGKILDIKNLKVVPGYAGTEGELAMMRGEIHGQVGSVDSMEPLIKSGDARPLVVIGRERMKEFPGVPTLFELSSPSEKPFAELMVASALLSRPFAGPPEIPPQRLAFLRKAFENAWKDPEVASQAAKLGRPIEFQDGETVAKLIHQALNQSPDTIAFLKKTMAEEGK